MTWVRSGKRAPPEGRTGGNVCHVVYNVHLLDVKTPDVGQNERVILFCPSFHLVCVQVKSTAKQDLHTSVSNVTWLTFCNENQDPAPSKVCLLHKKHL